MKKRNIIIISIVAVVVIVAILLAVFVPGANAASATKAKSIAQAKAPGYTFEKPERDWEDGKWVYEFEGVDKDGNECSIVVDPKSGKVLEMECETRETVDPAAMKASNVDEKKLVSIAEEKHPGYKFHVAELETDDDTGVLEAELKGHHHNGNHCEIDMNAQSGQIIKDEVDTAGHHGGHHD